VNILPVKKIDVVSDIILTDGKQGEMIVEAHMTLLKVLFK
jgi:hypothetical protein